MSTVQQAHDSTTQTRLADLAGRLESHAGFSGVLAALARGDAASLEGVWGGARALGIAALARHAPGRILVVCPRADDADLAADDLALFSPLTIERFPAWESEIGEQLVSDEIHSERIRVMKALAGGAVPKLIVTSIQALLQPVLSRTELERGTRKISVGESLDGDGLLAWLLQGGFSSTSAVELPGEFAQRGGIIDLFAPDWNHPVRIELFGPQIESLREFDVATQRSVGELSAVDITVARVGSAGRANVRPAAGEHLSDYLEDGAWVVLMEPSELAAEAQAYLERVDRPAALHTLESVLGQLNRFAVATLENLAASPHPVACRLGMESVERFSGEVGRVREELEQSAGDGPTWVVCNTQAESERLVEIFSGSALVSSGQLRFCVGHLSSGFRLVAEETLVLSGAELFHRTDLVRTVRRRTGRAIDSFLHLREGDLVVHLAHGIGRYRGLTLVERDGSAEEHLEIEFAGGTKIYVPSSKIALVQKYVGATRARPALARIGGRSWVRQKEAAEKAVTDLAVEMLQLQAIRQSKAGICFPKDTVWQQEFDASFPYEETPDQLSAIAAIKEDMAQPRPMDRLLCGDVGFGKTELAIRAAFKAVEAGYQVAVLVPTTILAEQHRRTFTERMAEFPFQIVALSRFAGRKEQRQVLKDLKQGTIDIVIGTHRLAQADVAFRNLGLVIIDEEQRFGVAIKERLKSYRAAVDVLTMTATPIPRTLHMALLGVRNISNLETPPEDRLAVETKVTRWNDELIRHAVMRELSRGGQVFFVHNRVRDIEAIAARLRRVVPEARLEIGHGQMPEDRLEKVMLRFLTHQFDLLLATTIVESGLDIPNANTLFIDEADRYGLADLHQLRGRVGRYRHRAYCYLLVDPGKNVSPQAARRLRAIEEFSQMGAGFALAMRDLELRGAGNILGTEQSGYITAVGYELYCSLLDQAVRRLKRLAPRDSVDVHVELPGESHIPADYVADIRARIDLYRRVAGIASEEDLNELTRELVDRFGPLPGPAERYLALARLRIWSHGWKIGAIRLEPGFVVLGYSSRQLVERIKTLSGGRLRVVDDRSAYLPVSKEFANLDEPLRILESLLRPQSTARYNPAP